jgi:hypothetical protein
MNDLCRLNYNFFLERAKQAIKDLRYRYHQRNSSPIVFNTPEEPGTNARHCILRRHVSRASNTGSPTKTRRASHPGIYLTKDVTDWSFKEEMLSQHSKGRRRTAYRQVSLKVQEDVRGPASDVASLQRLPPLPAYACLFTL